MPNPVRPQVLIQDFPGVMENIDPRDFPEGVAEVQVNAGSFVLGELTVRRGLKEVDFEN